MKQDVNSLYQQLVSSTVEFLEREENVGIDDLLSISSTLVCFAVDLIRNNTDASDTDIQMHLEEAIDVALLPEDELDALADEDSLQEESKTTSQTNFNNKKLLN